jgi:hypothetical protein
MIRDFISAVRAGLREFRRLRWVKRNARQVSLPF